MDGWMPSRAIDRVDDDDAWVCATTPPMTTAKNWSVYFRARVGRGRSIERSLARAVGERDDGEVARGVGG